jgi:integrase/recombinase XerD
MTPLRQRYIDDLRLKNFSPRTIRVYVQAVAKFAQHFGRSPDTLTREEVRAYRVQLIDLDMSRSYTVLCRSTLRHLYQDTLKRTD